MEPVLLLGRWDMQERSNCWIRKNLAGIGLGLEIGEMSANDRAREIASRQVRFLPKDQARASDRLSKKVSDVMLAPKTISSGCPPRKSASAARARRRAASVSTLVA